MKDETKDVKARRRSCDGSSPMLVMTSSQVAIWWETAGG